MRCVLYARKSTATNDDAQSRSTTQQLNVCHAFAVERGWSVVATFEEPEGTSGGSFLRPEFQRMVADVERGEFDAIIVHDISRFTRGDVVEALSMLRQLNDAGVAVYDTTTGAALDVEDEMQTLMTGFRAASSREYRKQIRSAILRQKRAAPREGFATSAPCLGFKLEGERKKKRIVVDQHSAGLVKQIYAWYAAGWSIARITDQLNGSKVVNPRQRPNALVAWSWTTVRQLLENPLPRGRIVTGRHLTLEGREMTRKQRTRNDGTPRKKIRIEAPPDAWHVREDPALRIIDAGTISIIDARLADRDAAKHGRPHGGKRGTPLLSGGLIVCGACGRRFETANAAKGYGTGGVYVCAGARRKAGCTNKARLPIKSTDQLVLEAFETSLLSPAARERLLAMVDGAPEAERQRLEAEAERLRGEISNLVKVAATGSATAEAVGSEIEARQLALKRIEARLAEAPAPRADRNVLRAALTKQSKDWRATLQGEPRLARELLRRVMDPLVINEPAEMPAYIRERLSLRIVPKADRILPMGHHRR